MNSIRPIRVVQVVDSLNMGGAQRVVARLAAAALPRPDAEVSVVTLRSPHDLTLTRQLRAQGVDVTCIPSRTRHQLADVTRIPRLGRVFRRNADVVQCHMGTANVVGVVAARFARRPSIVTLHTVQRAQGEHSGGALRRHISDMVLRHGPEHIVAVGQNVKAANTGRTGGSSVEVITNPAPVTAAVTADERADARRRFGDERGPIVVAVARLEAPKGLDLLLSAFAVAVRRIQDLQLLVAGEGSLRPQLERQAAALGITDRVRFLGQVDDVRSVLAAADLFVSSSRREGMPMAILEAMAAGLPIVATDVGDVGATVASAGMIVPADQQDPLADAIVSLLRDRPARDRLGTEALRLARDQFDETSWFEQWSSVWAAVANATSQPGSPGQRPARLR